MTMTASQQYRMKRPVGRRWLSGVCGLGLVLVLSMAIASAAYASGEPPRVQTHPYRYVGRTTATLQGSLNSGESPATYYYEYGTEPAHLTYKTKETVVNTKNRTLDEEVEVSSLTPGTTYYFRIVAKNSFGTSQGNEEDFTTDPPTWRIDGKEMASSESEALVEAPKVAQAFVLTSKFGSQEVKVECKSLSARNDSIKGAETGDDGGRGEAESLTFGECKVVGELAGECEIGSTLTTGVVVSELEGVAGMVKDKIVPKNGEEGFVEITFTKVAGGTCPATIKGNQRLKGSLVADLPEAGAEQTAQKLEFTSTSGSSLKLGANKAELTGSAQIELASKETFGA